MTKIYKFSATTNNNVVLGNGYIGVLYCEYFDKIDENDYLVDSTDYSWFLNGEPIEFYHLALAPKGLVKRMIDACTYNISDNLILSDEQEVNEDDYKIDWAMNSAE